MGCQGKNPFPRKILFIWCQLSHDPYIPLSQFISSGTGAIHDLSKEIMGEEERRVFRQAKDKGTLLSFEISFFDQVVCIELGFAALDNDLTFLEDVTL